MAETDAVEGARTGRGRGGRQARQAQRSGAGGAPIVIHGIRRAIPTYDLMSEEGLQRIEAAVDNLLQEVGPDFRDDDRCLELWRHAGAAVPGERCASPPGWCRASSRPCPPASPITPATGASVKIGGNDLVFSPAYGSPFVHDIDNGRRYGSLEHFQNFVKLAYASPWMHHSGGTVCEPVDVPVNKRHMDMVYSHIRFSDKPFMGSVTAEERAEDSIAMARLVFGDAFVEKNCVIMGNINVNSPLVYDGTMTKALRAYARANQCTVVVPFILGGAMGPVTTAGAIAQSMAEAMVGVALTQLERPGSPAILGNFLSSMSLRSGSPTFGTPEPALGSLVIGQLTRRLNLPLRCSGAFTTSKLPDSQAMMESAVSMQAAILCGAHFILHSAGWLEGGSRHGLYAMRLRCPFLRRAPHLSRRHPPGRQCPGAGFLPRGRARQAFLRLRPYAEELRDRLLGFRHRRQHLLRAMARRRGKGCDAPRQREMASHVAEL